MQNQIDLVGGFGLFLGTGTEDHRFDFCFAERSGIPFALAKDMAFVDWKHGPAAIEKCYLIGRRKKCKRKGHSNRQIFNGPDRMH